MSVDLFYPANHLLTKEHHVEQINFRVELNTCLTRAIHGSKDAESELVNRIGQLKRTFPKKIPDWIKEDVLLIIQYLKHTGRKVNFSSQDPRMWISKRDGSPRW